MSVIHYSHEEFAAAMAAAWNRGSIGSSDNLRYMERMADAATMISRANTDAYNATYTHDDTPAEPFTITAGEIKSAIIRQTIDAKLRGQRVLDGIRYNLVANNGQDFATFEILDWLLTFAKGAMRR